VNWHGGRGGHLGFSPVMPHDGAQAFAQYQRTRARYREFGLDYSGGFTLAERYMTNVNMIFYDRDNQDMTSRTMKLFAALVEDAAKAGYGEYRTHLSFMDEVARSFDFDHHALLRLNEMLKDAIDPNGILAPGKSGIWPRAYRQQRT
jgi:4-cresol dehydrogenase (hydroxylating)